MQKRFVLFMTILAMLLPGTSAFALETDISGFYQFMAAADNYRASWNYIGEFSDNSESEKLVDQRMRLKLDGEVNEQLSFTYQAEIDFQWGDSSFNTSRNEGGAIGGDTVNLETKHAYIDVAFDRDISARFGLQGYYDRFDYTLVAADMAGAKVNFRLGNTAMNAAMFNLIEGAFDESDNIYLWALQADLVSDDAMQFGADYYYYQNRGPAGYVNFIGTADMANINDFGSGDAGDPPATDDVAFNAGFTGNRADMDIHFLGFNGNYKLSDDSAVNGWLMLNNGTVDDALGAGVESDIQGYAASVRGTVKLGGADMAARLIYFNGDDDFTDGDFDFFVNPFAVENFAFYNDGFMIFLQDRNWANIGQYGFAMTDAAYAGFGLLAGHLTAKLAPTDNTSFECGVGYFASTEDKVVDTFPLGRTSRDGTTLGTELFVRAGYTFANAFNISLNGAYAALGDFYDAAGGGTAVNDTSMTSVDDPYIVSLVGNLSF